MIIVTLDCGDEVEFLDGRVEVERIEACPDCSNLIRQRMAAHQEIAPGAPWDRGSAFVLRSMPVSIPTDNRLGTFVRAELAHHGALDVVCDCCPHKLRFHIFGRYLARCRLCACAELYDGGCCAPAQAV